MKKKAASSRSYFIYFVVFAVNLISFSAGGCWSWTSPILPKLNSLDPNINPLPQPTTVLQDSWIAASMNLGALTGPLAGGFFAEKLGKKKALLSLAIPLVLSHVLCAFAVNVYVFFIARFLMGITAGTVFGVVPAYVADIAEDQNRGVLGSMVGVFGCSGTVLMYVIGPFLSVRAFSFANLITPAAFYILFAFFTPESPYDSIRQGKQKEAEETLMKLRNKTSGDVQKELMHITYSLEASNQVNRFAGIFKSRAIKKGLIISNGLMLFQQLSGICAVLGYMQHIFDMTGSSIPSIYSTMLIGFIQMVSNFASSQLVEKAGRRCLLIISHIFSIFSLIALGTYFFLKSSGRDVDQINWLPISSLILFIVAYNIGLANMPCVMLAELFPANIKGIFFTITSFFCLLLSFLVTMCFPFVSKALGMSGTFWIFAGALLVGLIFCIIIVPETKGKSSQEIHDMLEGTDRIGKNVLLRFDYVH